MSVTCLSVHIWKSRFPEDWRLLVEERIANIGIPLEVWVFAVLHIFCVLKFFWVFGSLKTMYSGEVSRGGYIAVSVGVSNG